MFLNKILTKQWYTYIQNRKNFLVWNKKITLTEQPPSKSSEIKVNFKEIRLTIRQKLPGMAVFRRLFKL